MVVSPRSPSPQLGRIEDNQARVAKAIELIKYVKDQIEFSEASSLTIELAEAIKNLEELENEHIN